MYQVIKQNEISNLLDLLFQKDIKLKISDYDPKTGRYALDESSFHDFLCKNIQVVKSLQHCANEDHIYEMELFRIKGGGKWCFGKDIKVITCHLRKKKKGT